MNPPRLSPANALVAHAERLVSGGRVLVVGNAEHNTAQALLERGARLVQVLDPDAKRVSHAAAHNSERRVTYAQLTDGALRGGSCDCALVEDLSTCPDPDLVVKALARTCGARGIAIIATTSDETPSSLLGTEPGGLGFDALETLASDNFEEVLLWGQSPFAGYSVVSLELEEPPLPALDNGFVEDAAELADFYVAVCGSSEALANLPVEDMTIVQLPTRRLLAGSASNAERRHRVAQRQLETLQEELDELRTRSGSGEVERLSRELERRDAWIRDLESRAERAETRAEDAEAELDRLEKAAQSQEAHRGQLAALQERLDEAERVAARSQKEARWAEQRTTKVESELEGALARTEELTKQLEAARANAEDKKERERLARTAKQQSDQVIRLESELKDRERSLDAAEQRIDELLDELEDLEAQLEEAERAAIAPASDVAASDVAAPDVAAPDVAVSDVAASDVAAPDVAASDEAEDFARIEAQLAERATELVTVKKQLEQLETYARSLVAEAKLQKLSQTENQPGTSGEDERIAAMARSLAEREADLVAARWTISELQQKIRSHAN